jgi:chlorite dismutase
MIGGHEASMTDHRHPGSPAPHAPAEAGDRFVVDLVEHGGAVRGAPQTLDARLFFRLLVFTGCADARAVVDAMAGSGLEAVVYADINDPYGVGVLVMSEDPATFTGAARDLFLREPFTSLIPLPDLSMVGRTYGTGREQNLEDWLLHKPRRNALNPDFPWAIWYPLRRLGSFNRLPRGEQGKIMGEHALIGRAYGEIGKAVDIRLECHGLDRDDNEFLLGIIGPELYPLSKLIKDMRSTRQTSEFIQTMGPFFVGRAIYQSKLR